MTFRKSVCRVTAAALALILQCMPCGQALSEEPGETQIREYDGVVEVHSNQAGFVVDDALTQNPVLENDLAPVNPVAGEGTSDIIALDVRTGTGESSFTVEGSLELNEPNHGADMGVYMETQGPDATVEIQEDVEVHNEPGDQPGGDERVLAYGVVARSLVAGEAEIEVGGSVSVSAVSENNETGATAVWAEAAGTGDAVAVVHVQGDAVAVSQGKEPEDQDMSLTHAVMAISESGASTEVEVGGRAVARSEDTVPAMAVEAEAVGSGSRTEVTIGQGTEGNVSAMAMSGGTTLVRVEAGGVTGENTAVTAVSAGEDSVTRMEIVGDTKGEDSGKRPGSAGAADLTASDGGRVEALFDGNMEAVSGNVRTDGNAEGGYDTSVLALTLNTVSHGGEVEAKAAGNVEAEASSESGGYVSAVALQAGADQGGSVQVEITGNAVADASTGNGIADAIAVDAWAQGSGSQVTVNVEGDAMASAKLTEQDPTGFGVRGVYADAMDGGQVTISVGGKAGAEGNPENLTYVQSVQAEAYGQDSVVQVTVGQGAEGQVTAISGNDARTLVTVQEGGVEAVSQGVYGASAGGETEIRIGGEILAVDSEDLPGIAYGVTLAAESGGEVKATFDGPITAVVSQSAEESYATGLGVSNEEGVIETIVIGDILAMGAESSYGIAVFSGENQQTDILVDGTVSGESAAVLLVSPETQIGENVTLTVWELVPNAENALITRSEDEEKAVGSEAEGEGGDTAAGQVQDREAEKAVQYIIRVRTGQEEIISTEGTFTHNGYNVAREGDTVTLKLTIPDGYSIREAYGDVDQSVRLLKDAQGNYYLQVPRGGAVELSVKLVSDSGPEEENGNGGSLPPMEYQVFTDDPEGIEDIPNPESNTPAPPGAGSVWRVTTVRDETNQVQIVFYSNMRYSIIFRDGHYERGRYRVDRGQILLIGSDDTERRISDEGVLTYISPVSGKVIFRLTREEMRKLKDR